MKPPSLLPVLDRVEGLRRVAGDEGLYKELIGIFLGDLPRILNEIDAAIAADASAPLKCVAHSLRGSANQIGACAVAQHAGNLEELARRGMVQGAATSRQRLGDALTQLATILNAEIDCKRRDT